MAAVAEAPQPSEHRSPSLSTPSPPPSAASPSSSSSTASSSFSSPSKSQSPSLELRFGVVTKDNVGQLQRLNAALFPVSYSDKFYRDAWSAEVKDVTHLAYHLDTVVGAVCAKLEQPQLTAEKILKREDAQRRLYIMTLGVLAPYRKHGVGSRLLQRLLDYAGKSADISEVYLHVQTSNEEALRFYHSFGFTITGTIANYYKRITPPDCYIVAKSISH